MVPVDPEPPWTLAGMKVNSATSGASTFKVVESVEPLIVALITAVTFAWTAIVATGKVIVVWSFGIVTVAGTVTEA